MLGGRYVKCQSELLMLLIASTRIITATISGEMKQWHHPKCLFETFERARATTKIIESSDEIDGFTTLNDDDKQMIKDLIAGTVEFSSLSLNLYYCVDWELLWLTNYTNISSCCNHYKAIDIFAIVFFVIVNIRKKFPHKKFLSAVLELLFLVGRF